MLFFRNKQDKLINYACFACHETIQQPLSQKAVACPGCAGAMANVGHKTDLPAENDEDRWETLEILFQHRARIEVTLL